MDKQTLENRSPDSVRNKYFTLLLWQLELQSGTDQGWDIAFDRYVNRQRKMKVLECFCVYAFM